MRWHIWILGPTLLACSATPVEPDPTGPPAPEATLERCVERADLPEPLAHLDRDGAYVALTVTSRDQVVESDQRYDLGDARLHHITTSEAGCAHHAITLHPITLPQLEPVRLETLQLPGLTAPLLWVQFVVDVQWGLTEEVAFAVHIDETGALTTSERIDIRRDAMSPPVFFSERRLEDRDGDGRAEVILARDGMGAFDPELVLTWSDDARTLVRSDTLSTAASAPAPDTQRDGSTPARAFRVCGVTGERRHLLAWTCPDGSAPFSTEGETAKARRGSTSGPDGLLDVYEVPCPSGARVLYYDMYACP